MIAARNFLPSRRQSVADYVFVKLAYRRSLLVLSFDWSRGWQVLSSKERRRLAPEVA